MPSESGDNRDRIFGGDWKSGFLPEIALSVLIKPYCSILRTKALSLNHQPSALFGLEEQAGSPLPGWAGYLIQVGAWFGSHSRESATKITVALSMPRVDYGAALLSLGVLTGDIKGVPELDAAERWELFVGRNVRFDDKDAKKVGKLEAVFKNPPALRILVQEVEEPDISEWSLADRIRYNPPKTTHSRVLLPKEKWDSVRPLSKEINLSRRRSVHQSANDDASVDSYDKLAKLFGPASADRLISSNRYVTSIVGGKSRMLTEMELGLTQLTSANPAKLHEYLRPSMMSQYVTGSLIQVVSSPEKAQFDEHTPVIAEADRNLPDFLTQTVKSNRIVLLGRNASSFTPASDAVFEAFAVRKGSAIDLPAACDSIDSLSFEH